MHEVRLAPEFSEEFVKLKSKSEKGSGEARYLLEILEKGLAKLMASPEAGKHIPKRLIPKEYQVKYGVTNLWKLNLDSYWRLIYTLEGDRVRLFAIVLEVLDHRKYDRKFGYHT
ncbi:type II toxin-antitoxin system RelE/ParE family toxin [Candidatus Micrarchaeota archaeon]|nr:type II toxin-antitoxin system RelE/ParE family toxin [Candidatus Micrarchaeota archaeon]